jgi:hypothetical protein
VIKTYYSLVLPQIHVAVPLREGTGRRPGTPRRPEDEDRDIALALDLDANPIERG